MNTSGAPRASAPPPSGPPSPAREALPAPPVLDERTGLAWVDVGACPVCGSRDARPFPRYACSIDHSYVRCRGCDVAYLSPRPVYDDEYLTGSYGGPAGATYDEDLARAVVNRSLDLLEDAERMLPGKGDLLDVGCSVGYLLSVARDRGWRVTGIDCGEPRLEACRKRGLDVRNEDITKAPVRRRFDLVTACHVLEHTPDPVGFLRALGSRLKEGGLLVVEVPNIDGPDEKLKRWLSVRGLKKPRITGAAHLFEFGREAFLWTAARAGLRVAACHTYGHQRTRGWIYRIRAAVYKRFLVGSKFRFFLKKADGA